ncbi:MAG TPA: hypothetical protein VE935_14785 [Burkholderiales bacterium]|nr:hypothetical protein [Burkholderiales bacterium]
MTPTRMLAVALATVIGLASAAACAELRGKVYLLVNPQAPRGEWQRRPLPGAFVAVSWTVIVPAPGHAVDSCRYSELARSDDKGEYVMEGPNFLTAAVADTAYYAYSPGFDPVSFPYPGSPISPKDITLTFSTRTPEERLSHIGGFTDPGCTPETLHDPRSLRVPYLRALLDEAKTLNVDTERGRRDVAYIEAVLRRATGQERPQRPRVVVVPGASEAANPQPAANPAEPR